MFRLLVTSDSNSETGVADANLSLTANGFYKFIEEQDYGNTLNSLVIIFMCRDPELHFKQRIRYSRKKQKLYMDIMLDYQTFVIMTPEQRVSELCKKLLTEMPPIVQKYKITDFDLDKLISNFSYWFNKYDLIIDLSDDLKNELKLDCEKIESEEPKPQEKRKSFFKRILLRK
ncbi:hypothetical protein [Acinetobacter terrae]|uniref:Uncharacterized protein n=1 Tax=Acinetobacter terrae TaxID=2731247 RepID=A0A7Y2RHZ2_9GAMM|nr:hypothetical protein [Acinetobacter terrae]NNH17183.1 hypothetical protein [Acinetobacter terrae]NNH79110.1 hypothetical protein [Acinetobacter terrae]NNH88592.1 hypothetical protein [Acinetobacter terrae]OAL76441.1 hypothetical protein AY608_09015 [Acinetobacter terrae]